MVFNPATALFQYWYNDATVNIAGVALDFQTILVAPGGFTNENAEVVLGGFGAAIGVSGGTQDLTLAVNLYLNALALEGPPPIGPAIAGCVLGFTSIDFNVTFPFCCIELVEVSLSFDCTGFGGITFAVTDVTFPNLPWMAWDITLKFDDGAVGKTLTIEPNLNLGDFACFTVYADLCYIENCFGGIDIYGIGLECDFNGCTFSSVSSLDPLKNAALIGYAEYWEKFCISCGGDSCCGDAFSFDICVYFQAADVSDIDLFDVGMLSADLAFGISSNFDLTSGITYVVSPIVSVSWCLGFAVTF
jgi:hypothetical protein